MVTPIKKESHEYFVTYLYVCVALSDYNLADEEVMEIYDKLRPFNLNEDQIRNLLKEVIKEYSKHSDAESIDFIKKHCSSICQSQQEKEKIFKDLEDIINADGIVKDVELIIYRNIKKILNSFTPQD